MAIFNKNPVPIPVKAAPVSVPMPAKPMSKVQVLGNIISRGAPLQVMPSQPSQPMPYKMGPSDQPVGSPMGNKPAPANAPTMPMGTPMPSLGTAPTATAKPAPLNPKYMKKGGKVYSASSRGDGIAQRGKTKGRFV
jgi:hypothetical protein